MKRSGMIKRLFCAVLIVMLVVMTAAPALAAGGAYVVTTTGKNKLRVHDSPGGTVKAKLKKWTVVAYKSTKSGWWYVSYRNGTGYVDKRYLKSVTKLPNAVYTSVDNLWVRIKPKADAAKMGKLKAGKKVIITGQKGSWVCVSNKSWSGWVPAKYLRRVK